MPTRMTLGPSVPSSKPVMPGNARPQSTTAWLCSRFGGQHGEYPPLR